MTGADAVERWCARHPLGLGVLFAGGLDPEDWQRPLAEACRSRGVALEVVEGAVDADERRLIEPWAGRPLTALLDHLIAHYHRPFAAMLAELEEEYTSREAHTLLAELRTDMAAHMTKEEGVLFPWLRTRGETAATPLRIMQLEHADTLQLVHAIHVVTARADPRALARWQHFEHWLCEHLHLENQLLVPSKPPAAR